MEDNNRLRSEVVYGALVEHSKMFTEILQHTPCNCPNVDKTLKFCPHCGQMRVSEKSAPMAGYNAETGVFRNIGVYGKSDHWKFVVIGVQLSCIDSKECMKELPDPDIVRIHGVVMDALKGTVFQDIEKLGVYHVVSSYFQDDTLIPLEDAEFEEVLDGQEICSSDGPEADGEVPV